MLGKTWGSERHGSSGAALLLPLLAGEISVVAD